MINLLKSILGYAAYNLFWKYFLFLFRVSFTKLVNSSVESLNSIDLTVDLNSFAIFSDVIKSVIKIIIKIIVIINIIFVVVGINVIING